MSNKNTPLAVVILAAGKGTRMKSDQPKVMHELAGLPMINWLIGTVEALEPKQIITVVGPDMPDLAQAAGAHEIVVQKNRNGTGGALACAMPLLKKCKGDVLVLLGDAPLLSLETIQALIDAKNANPSASLSVLGVHMDNPAGYGRLIQNADGTLKQITEEKDANDEERAVTLVNTGAFCIETTHLPNWLSKLNTNNAQGELYITDLPAIAAKDGIKTEIAVTDDPDEVRGCNNRADLAMLEATLQDYLRHAAMMEGVHMIDPSTVYLHYDTEIAPGVLIEPNLFCGKGVTIKEGAHIKAFCHFEDATIGENAIVGPFARLRPGTELGQQVKIGNFVEVKKSKVGARSKINHLGYVGDCTMGEDVNFSAGAITVNYDGFNKHKTTIGNNVMIGSNVNLVAPITIEEGAFVAAGSTLTKDVPGDALALTREPAKMLKGWAAKNRKRKAE